jgi:2-polyprenyl-3-methyl-5-hydroxy-6-metoxy-1,4-benzoquinol methylase
MSTDLKSQETVPAPRSAEAAGLGTSTEEFADRLFGSLLGTLDVISIFIGEQLGLYDALHRRGPLTVAEAAAHVDAHPRYVQEWLEQQTVAGITTVDDPSASAHERRYSLPDAHAEVLCNRDSLSYLTPVARMVGAAAVRLPELLEAYRNGGGVGWEHFGSWMRTGQAEQNRALFLQVLGREWLPSLPDVDARLREGGRIADIGTGEGWSAIGMARAYPRANIDGYDVDAASVEAATQHAGAEGLSERVSFTLTDAATVPEEASYDLVTAFECVHDMPDPVSVLAAARRLVKPDGTVLVMDEKVPEEFTGPGDQIEQFMYGVSMIVCLPDGMSHENSVGTGTVMRPATLRSYAQQAGFRDIEVLPIEHDMLRFYRLLQ